MKITPPVPKGAGALCGRLESNGGGEIEPPKNLLHVLSAAKDAIVRAGALHDWPPVCIIEEPAGQFGRADKVKTGAIDALADYSALVGDTFRRH